MHIIKSWIIEKILIAYILFITLGIFSIGFTALCRYYSNNRMTEIPDSSSLAVPINNFFADIADKVLPYLYVSDGIFISALIILLFAKSSYRLSTYN